MELTGVEHFGGIDADADDLLRDCFEDHSAYIAAREHKRFLIVGRKGSGKTAIFKRLVLERKHDYFSYGHTFEDYPWAHHDLQAESGVPEERRYIHSWKYLILMSASKVILNQDQSLPYDEDSFSALSALEQFVVDSYGSRDPDVTQVFTPSKEIKFKGSLKLLLGSLDLESLRVSDLPIHFQEVNKQVAEHVMRALNPEHSYYICFDQLDLGFSVSDQAYSDRLIGLVLAAREINNLAKEAGRKLSVIVFLRDDIYDRLQFEDKNKVTENHVSRIAWVASPPGLTLKSLMEKRFSQVFSGDGDAVAWGEVFDEDKEMPGRQTKYNHICDRTFLRPRDMIKFCNLVLETYMGRDDHSARFSNADVAEARNEYSQYLRRELDDEIAKHVPNYNDYLEVLKSIGRTNFSRQQFFAAWKRQRTLLELDPAEALRELFEFSVVGFLRPGGGGGGSVYVWRYKDNSARFSREADTFRVHPGFKEALDLSFGTRTGDN